MVFIFYYLHISLIYNNQRVISPAEPPAGFWFLQEQASKPMWKPRSPQQYCPPARSKACIKPQRRCQYRVAAIYLASGKRKSEGKPVSVKLAGIIIDIVTHMAPARQWLGHCHNERLHTAKGRFPPGSKHQAA
jgi:hypothetical protein